MTLLKSEVIVHHSRRLTQRASNLHKAIVTNSKIKRAVTASMGIFSQKTIFISFTQTLVLSVKSNRNRIISNKNKNGMETLIFMEHTLPINPETTLRNNNSNHKGIRTVPNMKTTSRSRSDHHHNPITRTESQIVNKDLTFSQRRRRSIFTKTLKIILISRKHSKMHKRISGAILRKTATRLKLMKSAGMSVRKNSVNTLLRRTRISIQTIVSTRKRLTSDGAHTSQASMSRYSKLGTVSTIRSSKMQSSASIVRPMNPWPGGR